MPYVPVIHPIPDDAPGTVRLKLDALVTVEQQGFAGNTHQRSIPGDALFINLANEIRPGSMGESDIAEGGAPAGYAAEIYDGGRATVLWPVRDQEQFDRVIRFIPHDQETLELFAQIKERLAPTGALA